MHRPEGLLKRQRVQEESHQHNRAVKTLVLFKNSSPVFKLHRSNPKKQNKMFSSWNLTPENKTWWGTSFKHFLAISHVPRDCGWRWFASELSECVLVCSLLCVHSSTAEKRWEHGGFWEPLPETNRARTSWNELEWFRNLESTLVPVVSLCLRKTMVLFCRHHYRSIGGWETWGKQSGGATF